MTNYTEQVGPTGAKGQLGLKGNPGEKGETGDPAGRRMHSSCACTLYSSS